MTTAVVCFSVPCVPVPQPRQRHRVVRSGPKAYATNYTPAKHPVNAFKAAVMLAARQEWKDEPLEGPVYLRLRFRFPLPASATVALTRRVAAGEHVPYIAKKRNDGDNLEKAVWDALTGICFHDDGQISLWQGERVYAFPPGVDVKVGPWEP